MKASNEVPLTRQVNYSGNVEHVNLDLLKLFFFLRERVTQKELACESESAPLLFFVVVHL